MNKTKLMSTTEPAAWRQGTGWRRPEGRREGDKGGKKGKGLVKVLISMTHRQHGGD